jgi:hypothetical protein
MNANATMTEPTQTATLGDFVGTGGDKGIDRLFERLLQRPQTTHTTPEPPALRFAPQEPIRRPVAVVVFGS